MYDKILLPTDGSKNSEKAIIHAVELANRHDAEIIIVNVVDSVYLTTLPDEELINESEEVLDVESQTVLDNVTKIIKDYCSKYNFDFSNVKLTPLTVEGSAADAILKVSEEQDVDIIVIASSGKHRLDRFILGSVTEKIVQNATIPILVIPSKEEDEETPE